METYSERILKVIRSMFPSLSLKKERSLKGEGILTLSTLTCPGWGLAGHLHGGGHLQGGGKAPPCGQLAFVVSCFGQSGAWAQPGALLPSLPSSASCEQAHRFSSPSFHSFAHKCSPRRGCPNSPTSANAIVCWWFSDVTLSFMRAAV